ncbi:MULTISPECIES: DUF2505 domain-containing protein [Rhodococcus]|uniref:DUF2505 domain-containing protein n=2 Tax=Rhodococcus TaxID=1827 RepID=A0A7T7LJL2_9NOCA|nr:MULTISPECIES: DUF2505 domain-containing protein [Rhodococcus]AOD22219.1 hypothetical protein IM25_11870 [Rhodococcus sp. p52]APE08207.1 hypothetical protein BO226_02365 [Rhodococcus sp. 2G]KHJ71687.1 hypothetical protein QR64_17245 [Rhodococcus sp. Chr-9]MCD2116481.1 DUF2505 domain-containing protein [Rhodococcus pyridinivorans]MCW3468510.1 DUF2505 domain-containing protein [Rhodococcus pyridinivorans]
MSKEFVFTSTLDHSVERVHGALTSEDFWNSRLAASQTGVAQLEVGSGPGTFRAKVSDQIDTSALPAVVRGVVRGPLIIERTDEWGGLGDGTAQGTLAGSTSGLPITIAARSELRGNADGGTEIEVRGEATVKVPVVGGQIEGLIVQLVENIVQNDRTDLDKWLTEN